MSKKRKTMLASEYYEKATRDRLNVSELSNVEVADSGIMSDAAVSRFRNKESKQTQMMTDKINMALDILLGEPLGEFKRMFDVEVSMEKKKLKPSERQKTFLGVIAALVDFYGLASWVKVEVETNYSETESDLFEGAVN